MSNMKQYIVVNRGLKMSRGKLMSQASHASMAWLTNMLHQNVKENNNSDCVECNLQFPVDIWENWIAGAFTKIILTVDSEGELEELINNLNKAGFREVNNCENGDKPDFFIIKDNCNTELTPDETGTRMTCIGFTPSSDPKLQEIMRKYKLFY